MKKKIVLTVSMCHKCRPKAMKIAVSIPGVESVKIAGEEKNQLEVVGEGVDSVKLTQRMRNKMAYAELVSVGEDKKKESDKKVAVLGLPCYAFPQCYCCEVSEPICTIM